MRQTNHPPSPFHGTWSHQHPVIVAVPARNEADRIVGCLRGLAAQTVKPDVVVVLANNCSDGTELVASRLACDMPFELHVERRHFPSSVANAGLARRVAMGRAAALAGDAGILLSTDADSVASPDWVERSCLALSRGADAVCGRATVDQDATASIPARLLADDGLEGELVELLDRLAAELDPDPANPWPRHAQASGASLGVTVSAFKRAGGIPALPCGEDRAFVRALVRIDSRIRHDPSVRVVVSGRVKGRAKGGMADTIRRRLKGLDKFTDAAVEPAADAYRRVMLRHRVRRAWVGTLSASDLVAELGLAQTQLAHWLNDGFFGAAWANIEANSPRLRRRRVSFADVPRQIAEVRRLLSKAPDIACPVWR